MHYSAARIQGTLLLLLLEPTHIFCCREQCPAYGSQTRHFVTAHPVLSAIARRQTDAANLRKRERQACECLANG